MQQADALNFKSCNVYLWSIKCNHGLFNLLMLVTWSVWFGHEGRKKNNSKMNNYVGKAYSYKEKVTYMSEKNVSMLCKFVF